MKWRPPPLDWLMCNVTFAWDKGRKFLGVAWVVQNHRGVVNCHSKRTFLDVLNKEDAKLTTILWAVESMVSMWLNKVMPVGEFRELVNAIARPQGLPAFGFQIDKFEQRLRGLEQYKLMVVNREANRGASFIAESVTKQEMVQSYVANKHVYLNSL